jgi:hypothetical protein
MVRNHPFSFIVARMGFASGTNAAVTVLEKDYYSILDIPITATPEQIKE